MNVTLQPAAIERWGLARTTTAHCDPGARIAHWEHYNAQHLVGLRCSAFSSRGLAAQQDNFSCDAMAVADIRGNEHVIERTPELISRHPKRSVFIGLLCDGHGFFHQQDHHFRVDPGDTLIYSTASPYLYGFDRRMRQIIIDIPAAQFSQQIAQLPPCQPFQLSCRQPHTRTYALAIRRAMLVFLARPGEQPLDELADAVYSILHTFFSNHDATRPPAPAQRMVLIEAKRFIAEHLGDDTLTATRVATTCQMSLRHLNRLFAAEGRTVTDYIWHTRLTKAHQELTRPATAARAVGDVAFQYGFKSQAHFSRAFKARYGMPPSHSRL